MAFTNTRFIKANVKNNNEFTYKNYAPMFRRRFELKDFKKAELTVCGLGYGYFYINGKKISKDLFTAPVSDYSKTLWYNTYDVTGLLEKGENILAVICGNGWYNEDCKSSWSFDEAIWRDVPKFIAELKVDGEVVLRSDESFKCLPESAIYFNDLRVGEFFDSRLYDEKWKEKDFDDSKWENAVIDKTPPTGIFRECKCEPICEHETYGVKNVYKISDKKFLFDMGQNLSGYARITVTGNEGDELVIRYAEQINEDLSLQLNDMERHYPQCEFQTDRLILCGKKITWSPMFTYHGFRYVLIEGIENADDVTVESVFVHQDIKDRTEFSSSDEFLNKLFFLGKKACWSNMFYMLTDCPTREKLGWTNDAQASTEQMLTNFDIERLLEKWIVDVWDAQLPDGSLPGIIPTAGWGYEWGNGPVSDGLLFEIPYRIYIHTGRKELLCNSLDKFEKYFDYIRTRTDSDGFVRFGLGDWTNPTSNELIPVEFVNAVFLYKFNMIAALAAEFSGLDKSKYEEETERQKKLLLDNFVSSDGRSKVNEQTPVAMLIYYGLSDIEPLKIQLKELVEKNGFRHNCGMVGLRFLFQALNKCGLYEYAYKIITAKESPCFNDWVKNDATTLWEMWGKEKHEESKNHHMYSDFMSWIIKTLVGFNQEDEFGYTGKTTVNPIFIAGVDYVDASVMLPQGKLRVSWKREDKIKLNITVPDGANVYYNGELLKSGINKTEVLR